MPGGLGKIMARLTGFAPAHTSWISHDLAVIKTKYVNFYLYRYQGGFIAFDTGFSVALAQRGCYELSINSEEVNYIFLTHSDDDHQGGVKAFPAATVYLSSLEHLLVSSGQWRAPFYRNRPLADCVYFTPPDPIQLPGLTLSVHQAPGHTPGSTIYGIDDQIYFIGDAFLLKEKLVQGFFSPFNMNNPQHRGSIDNIVPRLCGKLICTAHSGWQADFSCSQ